MQVTIDLPDWADAGDIAILSGIELVAFRPVHDKIWRVKVDRCANCGECCMDHKPQPFLTLDENGNCIHLANDGTKRICGKGAYRGYNCCVGDPILGKWKSTKCKVTYREG